MLGENIHEDADVFPASRCYGELKEVAADMLEDMLRIHGLQLSLSRRVGLSNDVTFGAASYEFFGLAEDAWPVDMPKQDVQHTSVARVA